jgi:hypothetical protein
MKTKCLLFCLIIISSFSVESSTFVKNNFEIEMVNGEMLLADEIPLNSASVLKFNLLSVTDVQRIIDLNENIEVDKTKALLKLKKEVLNLESKETGIGGGG